MTKSASQKLAANILLDILRQLGKRMHSKLKAHNKHTRYRTAPVFVASALWPHLRQVLKGITTVWERRSSSWVFALTCMEQLERLVQATFLVSEWDDVVCSIVCSDEHPVHVRYNVTSQQLLVQFSALARDLRGCVIVSPVMTVRPSSAAD